MSRGSSGRSPGSVIAGAVLEQPEQHLAEHLHLPGRAVAAVHLHRPVGRVERRGPRGAGRRPAGRPGASRAACRAAWSPARPRGRRRSAPRLRCSSRWSRPSEASSGCRTRRWLTSSRRGTGPARSASRCHRSPLGWGSHRCRSWWVASAAEQLDLGGRHPGVAEQRDPRRQVAGSRPEPLEGRGVPLVRVRRGHGLRERAPQRRLPGQVTVERAAEPVGGVAGGPVDQQLRPLRGVRREQAGQPPRHGVATAPPELGLVAGVAVAEVQREGGRPRLVEAAVEHRQQRPGQGVGRPRVVVAGAGQLGDQRAREPELDARAHPVTGAVAGRAEPVGQPLGEPPLHAARRARAPARSRTGRPAASPTARRGHRRAGRSAGRGGGGAPQRDPMAGQPTHLGVSARGAAAPPAPRPAPSRPGRSRGGRSARRPRSPGESRCASTGAAAYSSSSARWLAALSSSSSVNESAVIGSSSSATRSSRSATSAK